jgi:hypothetical protein
MPLLRMALNNKEAAADRTHRCDRDVIWHFDLGHVFCTSTKAYEETPVSWENDAVI